MTINKCDSIRYNYYGKTYNGTISGYRYNTANYREMIVSISTGHCIYIDAATGQGRKNAGYSMAIVKFDNTPETRAAIEVIRQSVHTQMGEREASDYMDGIMSTMAIPDAR